MRKTANTHVGLRDSPEYWAWASMLQRCSNPNNPSYKNYGGRGISVCGAWHDFDTFYWDVGCRPSHQHSIDRINNDGNYEPGNVRWATDAEQAANQRYRRNSVWLTHDGRTMTVTEWSKETGISRLIISKRLQRGWSVNEALSAPPMKDYGWLKKFAGWNRKTDACVLQAVTET